MCVGYSRAVLHRVFAGRRLLAIRYVLDTFTIVFAELLRLVRLVDDCLVLVHVTGWDFVCWIRLRLFRFLFFGVYSYCVC